MITEDDLAKTSMTVSYSFAPLRNIVCDLSGIVANAVRELIEAFYPRLAGRRVDVLLTELIDNILQNVVDGESRMFVDITVDEGELRVQTRNIVRDEDYEAVRRHVDLINHTDDLRGLIRRTIKERRQQRLSGGLGFMRLVHESKFQISVDYRESYLVIDARLDMADIIESAGGGE